jgi:hypothetical protein
MVEVYDCSSCWFYGLRADKDDDVVGFILEGNLFGVSIASRARESCRVDCTA